MYGTTMIGTLADGVAPEAIRAELDAWEKDHTVEGYESNHVLLSDDGKTLVNVVVFRSKEAYQALSDDPSQDIWWREHVVPLLSGEPTWIDGAWIS